MSKVLISAAEAARRLEVDRATVARWCRAGKLPAVRTPGGHWRVRAKVIRELERASGKD